MNKAKRVFVEKVPLLSPRYFINIFFENLIYSISAIYKYFSKT